MPKPEPSSTFAGSWLGLDPANELTRMALEMSPSFEGLAEMLLFSPRSASSDPPNGAPPPSWLRELRGRGRTDPRGTRDLIWSRLDASRRQLQSTESASQLPEEPPAEATSDTPAESTDPSAGAAGTGTAGGTELPAVSELCEGLSYWATLSRDAGFLTDGLLALAHALELGYARPRSAAFARALRRCSDFLGDAGKNPAAISALWAALDILLGCEADDSEISLTVARIAWRHLGERKVATALGTFRRARRLLDSADIDPSIRAEIRIGEAWAHLHLGQLTQVEEIATWLSDSSSTSAPQIFGLWLQAATLDARQRRREALDIYADAAALATAMGELTLAVMLLIDAAAVAVDHRDQHELERLRPDLRTLIDDLPPAAAMTLRQLMEIPVDELAAKVPMARRTLRALLVHRWTGGLTRFGEWAPLDTDSEAPAPDLAEG